MPGSYIGWRQRLHDEAPEELFAEGELQFFGKTSDVVTFDVDSQGKVTRLVVHTGGQSVPISRTS